MEEEQGVGTYPPWIMVTFSILTAVSPLVKISLMTSPSICRAATVLPFSHSCEAFFELNAANLLGILFILPELKCEIKIPSKLAVFMNWIESP